MRRHLPLFLFFFVPCVLRAQREVHLVYNRMVDRAMASAARHDHLAAMASYDSAIAVLPWEPAIYFDAVLSALATGRTDKANTWLLTGVANGFDPTLFTDPAWVRFMDSEESAPYRQRADQCRANFTSRADTAFIAQLDAMYRRDQITRDGSAEMLRNDSLNFEELITRCDAHGFPSAVEIGPSIGVVHLLLWHHRGPEYPDSPQWQRILPFIHTAMDAGRLDPAFLCMFDDLNDKDHGRPMRYGALLGYYRNMPEEVFLVDPVTLTMNRASVGWGPIADFADVVGVDPRLIRYAVK